MKLYSSNDMARIACDNCNGCSECCQGMGDTILLDPYDMMQLCKNTDTDFETLMHDAVELGVQEGMILPNLKMSQEQNQCQFLDQNGRCSIHAFRPGLCRLFPLGRNYEGGSFQYFVVDDGCPKEGKTKVKINKWLGIKDLKRHEAFLSQWHYFVKGFKRMIQEEAGTENGNELIRKRNMLMIQNLFVMPYDPELDFYEEVAERITAISEKTGVRVEV